MPARAYEFESHPRHQRTPNRRRQAGGSASGPRPWRSPASFLVALRGARYSPLGPPRSARPQRAFPKEFDDGRAETGDRGRNRPRHDGQPACERGVAGLGLPGRVRLLLLQHRRAGRRPHRRGHPLLLRRCGRQAPRRRRQRGAGVRRRGREHRLHLRPAPRPRELQLHPGERGAGDRRESTATASARAWLSRVRATT